MKNNIELYINNTKVDLSDNTKILFTYRIKDVYNPVAVKNSFTKTVTLEGTPTNNKVFNHLYNLDVSYSDGSLQTFNSSKRNPFELYDNGELIESGYMKLDSIKHTGNLVNYNCTLYGGLGDFLYNLMYDSTGEKKTLASLDFGEDINFRINKDTVKTAWERLNSSGNTNSSIWDIINFMPSYNGISDTIDSEHIVVNTNGYSGKMREWSDAENSWVDVDGFPTGISNNSDYDGPRSQYTGQTRPSGDTYTLNNGYALVELPKPMSEWQTRDLRSYMQRPVVNMKKIIDACCDQKNNGGYEVILDTDFFNSKNPYYQNAWITLPLLNDLKNKEYIDESVSFTKITGSFERGVNAYQDRLLPFVTGIIPTASAVANFSCKFRLRRDSTGGWGGSGVSLTSSTASLSTSITGTEPSNWSYGQITGKHYSGYALQLVGLDNQGKIVAESEKYWLTSYISNTNDYLSSYDAGLNSSSVEVKTQIGDFNRVNSSYYEWPETLTFTMDMTNIAIDKVAIRFMYITALNGKVKKTNAWYGSALFASKNLTVNNYANNFGRYGLYNTGTLADMNFNENFPNADLKIQTGGEEVPIYSNSPITKNMLLTTDNSPADYLLSFTKLFNLYIEKDIFEKKIYIKTQRNYYDGEKIDINDYIDRSKEISINPLAFDTNTYEMKYKDGDKSTLEDKYSANYGNDFGSQRIITGYDFDSEKKQLYDGVFKNGLTALESGRFYTQAQVDATNEIPTFLYATVTYKLFNSEGETSERRISRPKSLVETAINKKSTSTTQSLVSPFYDAFPKLQFNNNNEPIDGKDVLVFFNGFKEPYTQTYQPYYLLSDDIQQMITWCDKPCYLYSQSEYNISNTNICYRITNLPQFSRYITIDKDDAIYYSMDIGRTKELYIPDMKFVNSDATIYERYWDKYITDLYDIDTRIVDCYVRFDKKVIMDYLKHYYYFDNSYWVISEIIDYNPDSNETIRVKFVKVNEFGVYTDYSPSELPEGVIVLTVNPNMIGTGGTSVNAYVWCADDCEWTLNYPDSLIPTVISGVGPVNFTISVPSNSETYSKTYKITATTVQTATVDSVSSVATITQIGTATDVTFTVKQFAQYTNGNVPQSGGTCLLTVRSTFPWTVESDRTWAQPIGTHSTGGTGDTEYGETLEVKFEPNNSYDLRSVRLTFTNSLGQKIYWNKQQNRIEEEIYYQYTYPSSGGVYTVYNLVSGGTVETKPDWITVTDNGDGSYTFTAVQNTGSLRNGDAIILMNLSDTPKVRVQLSQEPGQVIPDFDVTPTVLYFLSGGSSENLYITNGLGDTWRVVAYPEWITVNPSGGTIEGNVIVTAGENTGDTRVGTLVIYNVTTDKTYAVTCSQESSDNPVKFEVTPNVLQFSYTGDTKRFTITNTGNHNWDIIEYPFWISKIIYGQTSKSGSGPVDIEVAENPEDIARTGDIVVYDKNTDKTYTVKLVQEANPNGSRFKVTPSLIEFTSSSGYQYITITNPDNDNWRITSPSEWYGFNQSQGRTSTTISCFAEANTGNTRTDRIVFYNATTRREHYVTIVQYGAGSSPSITLNPSTLTVDATGGTSQVTITYTNRDGDFIIPTPSSTAVTVGDIVFTGDTAVVDITVAENIELSQKDYTVVFAGSNDSVILNITQSGATAILNVVPTSITFGNTGGTATFTIITNDTWKIN